MIDRDLSRAGKWTRAIVTGMAIGCIAAMAGSNGRLRGMPADLDAMSTGSVTTGVFASVAFPFKPGMSTRWNEIERRSDGFASEDCDGSATCKVRLGLLRETTDAVRDLPLARRIAAVNVAVNRLIAYRSDREVYGKLDYWATPREALTAGRGDCEDFAILKMAALRGAGVPSDSMALVILRDSVRNFYHAVLAVSTSSNIYILDNLRDSVLTDRELVQYQALYSLSANKAWVHGYKRGTLFAMQQRPASLESIQPGEGVADTAVETSARPFPLRAIHSTGRYSGL